MNPETKFKIKVQKDLVAARKAGKLPHLWFFKTQEVTVRGIPDILMCLNGVFVALELKKDDKTKPEKLQEYILGRITEAKGLAFKVGPKAWPAVLDFLISVSAWEPPGPRRTRKRKKS